MLLSTKYTSEFKDSLLEKLEKYLLKDQWKSYDNKKHHFSIFSLGSTPGLRTEPKMSIVLIYLMLLLLSLQPCLTLCDPKNYSPPGSSVHGILQARILEWIAMSSSQGSSWPRDLLTSPALAGGFFTTSAIPLYWEPKTLYYTYTNKSWEFCFAKHNRFAHTWNEMTVGMLLANFSIPQF